MAGEATTRLLGLMNQATARLARRVQMIEDMYAPEPFIGNITEMSWEEVINHYDTHGHWAPQTGCKDPVCIKAALFMKDVVAQVSAQLGGGQGNGATQ